ncbi:MAG: molybdenum cofactor biosynthesis protein MoaE [Candidatus Dormibacteraeota bacterium]|nr:molybdenum cofactor biosynthesis protein MoaE [Candidatus Dormibacteraeota bacterium]
MADAPSVVSVALTRDAIYLPALVSALPGPADGAVATFVGVVRDNHDGRAVSHLEYEAHEPMALRQMGLLGEQAMARWGLSAVTLEHRLGRLEIGDISVFVGVASPHRAEGLEACHWLIDTLKAEVPVFKREFFLDGGTSWVEEEAPAL